MKRSKIDVILHPVRMRIIQAMVGGKRLTVNELGQLLPDVPPATLYRHLNSLAEAGILVAVDERKVRGTAEKIYELREEGLEVSPEELAKATPEDHMRFFTRFVAGLLGSFGRYLGGGDIDFARDGVGYRQVTLQLNDEELQALLGENSALLRQAMTNEPRADRRARVITRIVMPVEPTKREAGDTAERPSS